MLSSPASSCRERRVTSTSTAPVRWGIVGPGRIVVNQIAPALARSSGSRMVACAAQSPGKGEAFAREFGLARWHVDHQALCADPEVEAVYIATPNALHHPMVLAAAHAGKHVLCEKPLALTVEHAREMVEACARAGVLLRVGFYLRFEAVLERARTIVRSGVLGELRAISLARTGPALLRAGWRLEAVQGGALFDMAVHLLDLAEWLSGARLTSIAASSHPDRRDGLADDTIAIVGSLADGCQVLARASRETPHAANDLVIEGTRGMLATSSLRWSKTYHLRVVTDAGTVEEHIAASPGYALELAAFERELRGEPGLVATGEEGVRAVELACAVTDSIEQRRIVPV